MKKNTTIICLTSLTFLTGCLDFDIDITVEPTLDGNSNNVEVFAQKYYDFHLNLGFSKEASKGMWMIYMLLYQKNNIFTDEASINKPPPDTIVGTDTGTKVISHKDNITYNDAKNVFACTILDGRAVIPYKNRTEIESSFLEYKLLFLKMKEIDAAVHKEYPDLSKDDKMDIGQQMLFEELGPKPFDKIINKISALVGFNNLYRKCGYLNEPEYYLDREEIFSLE